jgi:hypothetical protein
MNSRPQGFYRGINFPFLSKLLKVSKGETQVTQAVPDKTRDRCYDFLNIFAEKFCEKMAFLTQNKAKFLKKVNHNIGI